jgi:hypothetical protein
VKTRPVSQAFAFSNATCIAYCEDPAIDVKSVEGRDAAAKSAALSRSVIKPYSVAGVGADGHTEKFVALMLPAKPDEPAKEAGDGVGRLYCTSRIQIQLTLGSLKAPGF